MALLDLAEGDVLRLIQFSDDSTIAEFFVISNDEIDEDLIDADVNVQVPVYGNPFFMYSNPVGSRYTSMSVELEGPADSFDLVADNCAAAGTFQIVKLVIGGEFATQRDFVKGVVTGVSRKRKVTRGDGWVEGSLSFILIP